MSITRYKSSHYKAIASWYKARNLQAPPRESLSDMGYIVDERVAGWLYLTNSNIALIEGVISNPFTVPSLRKQSLRKLAGLLVDSALTLGYTTINISTNHPTIEKLAKDMGFKEYNLKTFILNEELEDNDEAGKGVSSVYNSLFQDGEGDE